MHEDTKTYVFCGQMHVHSRHYHSDVGNPKVWECPGVARGPSVDNYDPELMAEPTKQCSRSYSHPPHPWTNTDGAAMCPGLLEDALESPPKQALLEEALRIVTGPRQMLYGKPSQNFIDTADLVDSYLRARGILHPDAGIAPHDVAVIILLLKVARIATSPGHMDNWIDIAGYAACGWEAYVEEEREHEDGG